MADRIIVVLPDDASDDDRHAAVAAGADEVISRSELGSRRAAPPPELPSFTSAESGVLTELAHRPDTRSRVAARLGITTSTLDNHVAAIKRKVLDHLATSENAPADGYLSMEGLIGWAMRHSGGQKT